VLVKQLANEMLIGSHNAGIDKLGEKFEEEVPDAFPDALDRLRTAMGELKELCEQHETALQQRAEEVRARVDKASQALERMAPALAGAQQLG
jgi:uncharacterized protein YukE